MKLICQTLEGGVVYIVIQTAPTQGFIKSERKRSNIWHVSEHALPKPGHCTHQDRDGRRVNNCPTRERLLGRALDESNAHMSTTIDV